MVTLLNTVEDKKAREICKAHGDAADAVLEILHDVQAGKGYITDAALRTIAQSVNISQAEIHGIVSFYHDYKRKAQPGKRIKICRAEACQAVGANDLIREAEEAFDLTLDGGGKELALEATYCLGNCALGPAVMMDDQLYGRADLDLIKSLAGDAS